MAVGLGAAGYGEEFVLQLAGDGAGYAFAYLDVVDGTNGRDFDGGAGKEYFVDDVEHFARDYLLLHRDLQIFGDFHDGVAGDAGQNAGGQWRRIQGAVVHKENIHAGAFADVAVGVESDAFRVAVEAGFHADELRVHVVGGGFGHGGKRIGSDAGPGADADVDTFSESFRAKVGAPGPTSHINVDRGTKRINADFAVAAENDRLHVAGVEFVQAHNFGGCVAEIVDRVGKIHPIDLGGVDQALHMLAQPEDGRALLGFVAANAFKDRGAVADDMGEYVECGVIPVDEFSVVPDFIGLGDGHLRSSGAVPLQNTVAGLAASMRSRYKL